MLVRIHRSVVDVDVSMNAFTRLFTTDLVANDCRVFDWVAAVNKK